MKRSGHVVSSHSGFILIGGSRGGGAEGPQFFFFGDRASLLSQGLDERSATDSSIHKLWYETQSICVEEGRRSFKSLPDYNFPK